MKFMRVETPGILMPIIRFKEQGEESTLEVSASSVGISLSGESSIIETGAELQQFAKVIGDAWKEHERLKEASLVHP